MALAFAAARQYAAVMKIQKRTNFIQKRPSRLVWGCAVGAVALMFSLPDLMEPGAVARIAQDLRGEVETRLKNYLPGDGTSGTATVIDGDTIDIRDQRYRLHAMDAPESAQKCWKGGQEWRCGQQAALALQNLINRRPVRCEQTDRDRYGRIVARCYVGTTDIGGWLVEQGLALAAPQYGKDYLAHEERAKKARVGMWEGEFIKPSDWRKGVRSLES